MVEALESLGRFDISVIDDHGALFERILEAEPDLVVNFCDTGVFNLPTRELHLPAWLELHDIPYSGASPQAMVLCFDKQAVRLIAEALGVEVPREAYVPAGAALDRLPDIFPALLKPNRADGSVGITKDAVVRDAAEARSYLGFLARTLPGRDVLWQEYLPGAEYGIGLIGNPETKLTALPALEVDFSACPRGSIPSSRSNPRPIRVRPIGPTSASPAPSSMRPSRRALPAGARCCSRASACATTAASISGWPPTADRG